MLCPSVDNIQWHTIMALVRSTGLTEGRHVLMVSIQAMGHLIPLLELAKKLAHHHRISFAVSESHLSTMRHKGLIPLDGDLGITLIGIKDGYASGFHTLQEFIDSAIPGVINFFNNVFTAESHSNHAGVQMPVDVVIADDLLAPTFPVLHRYHVPFYSFNSGSVGRLLHYLSITAATPTCSDPERVPFIEVPAVEGCQPPAVLEIFKKVYLPVHETIHLARGVICNAVDGMEEEFVKRVKKHPDMAGVALYTVGPLFQDDGPRLNAEKHDATTQVLEWLNKKEPFSVVYVSFSTVVKLQPQQIDVISKALTAFGQPFIWSLPDAEQAFLPANLSAGIKHQWADEAASFLILNWAPQKLILDHTATSVALSHCGFNSTMECLTAGVPVAAWPQATDQKMDALLLEHCGTGLLIKGTGDRATGETVTAAAVEEALRRVSCLPFQAAADEWKNKMKEVTCPTGSSQRDLTTLVKDLSL